MTLDIKEVDNGVKITYSDGSDTSECVIIGLSKSEVKDRVDEFVSAHGLD